MKLLVFAHTPPPHHGQSYMVKLMLDALGGDARRSRQTAGRNPPPGIACYHVNARFSKGMEDIGTFRAGKSLLIVRYCVEAIWCRFHYGVRAFYYIPAPGKRAALYRDWAVMLLCRPFFRDLIHHWHAVGLSDWLREEGHWFERWLTQRLLGRPALALVLANPGSRDALWFRSRRVAVVPNGIPDPSPEFATALRSRRQTRLDARRRLLTEASGRETGPSADLEDPHTCQVLFLAHGTMEKGLFDCIEGVLLANEQLRTRHVPVRFRLTMAGVFPDAAEEREFRAYASREKGHIEYAGFVSGSTKSELLASSDVFCFPTYYAAEGQPVNLIEAIAFGLPVVTTAWRAIPEILPPNYPGFVPPRDPPAVAAALIAAASEDGTPLRTHFLATYTLAKHVEILQKEILALEAGAAARALSAPTAK